MAEKEKKEEKKIIADEDWKKQAQREKEILSQQEKSGEKKAESSKASREPLPKGDLAALISMLVTQALFSLGLLQVQDQEEKEPDLHLAKYNIDMLETLQEKTKGNLTEQEEKVLEDTLHQVRMAYVKMAK